MAYSDADMLSYSCSSIRRTEFLIWPSIRAYQKTIRTESVSTPNLSSGADLQSGSWTDFPIIISAFWNKRDIRLFKGFFRYDFDFGFAFGITQ